MKKIASMLVFAVVLGVGAVNAQAELRLQVPNFPPFTFEKDGKIQGTGVDAATKILTEAGLKFTLTTVPNFGKAVADLKGGASDGFFLGTRTAERDGLAVLSSTIDNNHWCWFIPASSSLDPKAPSFAAAARVGTVINGAPQAWLTERGYKLGGTPNTSDLLLPMLKADRINAVFMAERVFLETIAKAGMKASDFKVVVQVEQPMGIYISKEYLKRNPGAMDKINAAVAKIVKK